MNRSKNLLMLKFITPTVISNNKLAHYRNEITELDNNMYQLNSVVKESLGIFKVQVGKPIIKWRTRKQNRSEARIQGRSCIDATIAISKEGFSLISEIREGNKINKSRSKCDCGNEREFLYSEIAIKFYESREIGWLHECFRRMVFERYGKDVWLKILQSSNE
ncbi:hypothetical protein X798_02085 [Onchocerca flexuosa]|uniref:Uncharacterized protein n=1 Tax=Onchocerca flexuosa TaxID=387005 RepID=A0A238C0F9_9BILA|nr:hypothetical protein X798_02085 [Onchocerca flexuosa]